MENIKKPIQNLLDNCNKIKLKILAKEYLELIISNVPSNVSETDKITKYTNYINNNIKSGIMSIDNFKTCIKNAIKQSLQNNCPSSAPVPTLSSSSSYFRLY